MLQYGGPNAVLRMSELRSSPLTIFRVYPERPFDNKLANSIDQEHSKRVIPSGSWARPHLYLDILVNYNGGERFYNVCTVEANLV